MREKGQNSPVISDKLSSLGGVSSENSQLTSPNESSMSSSVPSMNDGDLGNLGSFQPAFLKRSSPRVSFMNDENLRNPANQDEFSNGQTGPLKNATVINPRVTLQNYRPLPLRFPSNPVPFFPNPQHRPQKNPQQLHFEYIHRPQSNPKQVEMQRRLAYAEAQRRSRSRIKFNVDERLNGSSNMLDFAQRRSQGYTPIDPAPNKFQSGKIYSDKQGYQIQLYRSAAIRGRPEVDEFEEEIKSIVS